MRLLIVILLLGAKTGLAQKVTIQGVLKDSAAAGLPSATVLLLSPKDSSLVNFSASNNDGFFQMKNVPRQSYILKVSYVGHKTLMRSFDVGPDQVIVDLGELRMEVQISHLNEVTVTGERIPVVIKKDTIEYNAASFKTKENAIVEDLLKKLPEVEVDNDGTVRAQGEQVRRVTVDGKNFFGTDPKLATRNLPADAIAKVQVFDKKSDQAAFTGIDDGQREKTINLELKEEKRKGAFGTLMAGAGSDERAQAKASVNQFRKDRQLSFLGMANNVNEQGFGMDDYMNFTGGSQQMMGGRGGGAVRIEISSDNSNGIPLSFGNRNNGLMSSYAGGLNFNKQMNKNTEVNSSYFYNHLNHNTDIDLDRINYLPNGMENIFAQTSARRNTNDNHRVSTVLDHKIDSLNSLKLTTNFTHNETEMNESSSSSTTMNDMLLNTSDRQTVTLGSSTGINSNLLWRHRFAKKGRTLSANLQLGYTESDRAGSQNALIRQGPEAIETTLDQINDQLVNNLSYGTTLTYTEPLGNRKYIEGNYTFRENRNDFSRYVYDVSGDDPLLVEGLSADYNSAYEYHRGGMNFRINRSKYNFTVGTSLQQTYLDGHLKIQDLEIKKSFQNVLPVLRFNYEFTNMKRVKFDYETSVQEPTIQQLQPVPDNSDPLNLYVGNPNLRPSYTQNFRVNFMSFNPTNFFNFFAFVDASFIENAISQSQSFSNEGVRITRPVNVSNNRRVTGNASFGFPINKIKSRFNISANVSHQGGVMIINDSENNTVQNTIGTRLRYEFTYNDVFDISLSANMDRQTAEYDLNTQQDQLYFNNTYNAEANLTFLKNYSVNGSFEYLVYKNKTNDFEQTVPLLNLSVSRFLLKAKSGELRFSVNNLLDQNIGISQTASLNYFERQRMNNLGRYFMVSFIYSLNKQLNPLGNRPRGGGRGMIRMMR